MKGKRRRMARTSILDTPAIAFQCSMLSAGAASDCLELIGQDWKHSSLPSLEQR